MCPNERIVISRRISSSMVSFSAVSKSDFCDIDGRGELVDPEDLNFLIFPSSLFFSISCRDIRP